MSTSTENKSFAYTIGEWIAYAFMLMIFLFLLRGGLYFYNYLVPFEGYSQKAVLKKDLSIAIKNDADLETIHSIFDRRDISDSFYHRFWPEPEDVFVEPVKLEEVLLDLKASEYKSDKPDAESLKNLASLIDENRKTDPFSVLQEYQRERFENVRVKLGDNYTLVENEIVKISDDLNKQNQLVIEYLASSEASFWLSILGLFLSVFFSIYQIILSKRINDTNENS